MLTIDREQAIAHRLRANHLHERLPAGRLVEAARCAIQDTVPRSALLSLHARVRDVGPSAWEHSSLLQLWSPRTAVHVVPAADLAVFTLGRLPRDPAGRRAVEEAARQVHQALAGRERRKSDLWPGLSRALFLASRSGTIAIRWDARDTLVREVRPPEVDPETARIELCRRHLRALGPSTPDAFAWWAGVDPAEAGQTWRVLSPELYEVEVEGHPAWILACDEPALASPPPVSGVRLLPAEELKLFGQDRTGLFAGPARRVARPFADWDHPGCLLAGGRPAGAWGRRGGRVDVRVGQGLAPETRAAIEAEALSLPIPGAAMSVRITEVPDA